MRDLSGFFDTFIQGLILTTVFAIFGFVVSIVRKIFRGEKITQKNELQNNSPKRQWDTECAGCGWPEEAQYAPPEGGMPIDWIKTDDGDNICPKCGKVNLGNR